jgi:PIN domain nuclease of toxin-antitoxin system
MKLIIDTQILIWWLTANKRLPNKAAEIIADGTNEVLVSAASVWEMAIKISLGKIQLSLENDFQERLIANGLMPVAVKLSHALESAKLPLHHRDPFDRMLVAQSLIEDCYLLTTDTQLAAYGKTVLVV